MHHNALTDRLLAEVEQELSSYGFHRHEQTFTLDHGAVVWMIHVAFIPHAIACDVTCDFAVRFHAVQDVLRASRYPTLSTREFRDTATAGAELGNYARGQLQLWTLASDADVGPVAADLRYWYLEHMRYYLEELSTLEQLATVLSEGGRQANLLCPHPGQREQVLEAIREVTTERPR
jgi:hypothetical protein